jgi:hypothetical protein
VITEVGVLHADHAEPGDRPAGLPTSSAILPSLVVQMLRHTSSVTVPISSKSAPDRGTAAPSWQRGWVTGTLRASMSMST